MLLNEITSYVNTNRAFKSDQLPWFYP